MNKQELKAKLLEQINNNNTSHLLRDKTREIVAKHSQSNKVTPQRMQEIVDEAFSPENSIFKRKVREREQNI